MNKLVDIFLYSGAHEHDMVRLRHQTLRDHVDEMVAVSCDLTYQGELSPFEPPPDDLDLTWTTVKATQPPDKSEWGGQHWGWVETQHRDLICKRLPEIIEVADDDVVMLSDMDEIPDPRFLNEIIDSVGLFKWVAVPMRMHGFALDYLYPTQLLHTTVCEFKDLEPQKQRNARYGAFQCGWGWHLSWLGDLAAKERKLSWFSHGELQDLDVEACWRKGMHANGEELIKLNREQINNMSWPKSLFSDEFTIPHEWWSPNASK
jgi:glycosyl transferase family 17